MLIFVRNLYNKTAKAILDIARIDKLNVVTFQGISINNLQ